MIIDLGWSLLCPGSCSLVGMRIFPTVVRSLCSAASGEVDTPVRWGARVQVSACASMSDGGSVSWYVGGVEEVLATIFVLAAQRGQIWRAVIPVYPTGPH